jgi:uncharacterized protein (TIGR00251 family)
VGPSGAGPITATSDGVRIRIHVQPRAARTEAVGLHGEAIKIRLAAPPVEGAANVELVRFLAARLKVPARQVSLDSGATSRQKTLTIAGVTVEQATGALLGSG